MDPLPEGKPSNHWTSREFPGITLLFIYSLLAVLGLHCCVSTSLAAVSEGCSLTEARGLLLFQNMGFRGCSFQALEHKLSSWGSEA